MTEFASLLQAVNACMAECGYVHKGKQNDFHRYRYAGEDDLLVVLRPAMVRHGLLLFPSVVSVDGPDEHGNTTVVMDYTLAHKSGAVWPEKIRAAGCGNDRNRQGGIGDKGLFKAITGANKYLLFKLFQIETGDDPERASVLDQEHGAAETPQAPAQRRQPAAAAQQRQKPASPASGQRSGSNGHAEPKTPGAALVPGEKIILRDARGANASSPFETPFFALQWIENAIESADNAKAVRALFINNTDFLKACRDGGDEAVASRYCDVQTTYQDRLRTLEGRT